MKIIKFNGTIYLISIIIISWNEGIYYFDLILGILVNTQYV